MYTTSQRARPRAGAGRHTTTQERFGTLQGRVTDQQDAAIPGVTVTVTSLSSEARSLDANGHLPRQSESQPVQGAVRSLPDSRASSATSVVLGRSFEVSAH